MTYTNAPIRGDNECCCSQHGYAPHSLKCDKCYDALVARLAAMQDICLPPFGHAFTVPHNRMDEQFLAWLRQNCVIVTEAEYTRLAAAERDARRYRQVWSDCPLTFGEMLENVYGIFPIESKNQGDSAIDSAIDAALERQP